jgi:hypothetical protein
VLNIVSQPDTELKEDQEKDEATAFQKSAKITTQLFLRPSNMLNSTTLYGTYEKITTQLSLSPSNMHYTAIVFHDFLRYK